LEHGFYKIKNLDVGGLAGTSLTFGPGKIEGIDAVNVYQIQNAKAVRDSGSGHVGTCTSRTVWFSKDKINEEGRSENKEQEDHLER
jgi:hypothetical protein